MAKKKKAGKVIELAGNKYGLNPKQVMFCQHYVSEEFFASGINSYAAAYGLNLAIAKEYNTCKVNASRLLTSANICKQINDLLTADGLNYEFADKQLLFVMNQHVDLHAKMAAVKEFNKMKGRITEKHSLTITKLGKDLEEEIYEDKK